MAEEELARGEEGGPRGPGGRDGTDTADPCAEGGVVRRHIGGRADSVTSVTSVTPPRPHAVLRCPPRNGLPHRCWSCSRRWLRKTRPWASWSRASASWRRPPSTAPSSGRSPMSPGAATSQPVAGPSASSPQVPAPQGHSPAWGGRLPWAQETRRDSGQLCDIPATYHAGLVEVAGSPLSPVEHGRLEPGRPSASLTSVVFCK